MFNKCYSVHNFTTSKDIDILCISETFLSSDKTLPPLHGYDFYRLDRNFTNTGKRRGGGVAMYINNFLTSKPYILSCSDEILNTSQVECIVTSIKSGKQKAILVACIYRPPKYDMNTVEMDLHAIDIILTELTKTQKAFIVTGDFNLKYGWCYSKLEHIIMKYKVKQLITENTREDSLLDLILTNKPDMCTDTHVYQPHISDHYAVCTKINVKKPKKNKTTFKYRNYRSINLDNTSKYMHMFVSDVNKSVLEVFDSFHYAMNIITDQLAPCKSKTVIQHTKKLILGETTKQAMASRDSLYKQYKRTKRMNDKHIYNLQAKRVKKLINMDMKSHIQQDIQEKGFWPIINKLSQQRKTCNLSFNADEINDYFTSISNKPLNSTPCSINTMSPDKFQIQPILPIELKYAWKKMKNKESMSIDGIGMSNYLFNILLKHDTFFTHTLNMLNMSIDQCVIPPKMKLAKIIAIPKVPQPTSPNDMRPISILPVISKILERCVYLQLRRYVLTNNVLYCHQYGFRPKHSTEHAELYIYNKAKSAIQRKNMYAIVSLDVKKAFDSINRDILYNKLEESNIDSSWFRAYFTERSQYVQCDTKCSQTSTTIRGIPQGGCISGITFALYINNLHKVISSSELILFADDSQTCKEVRKSNINEDISDLQVDCNNIAKWFMNNDLELNINKTVFIVHSDAKMKIRASNLMINICGENVKCSDKVKSLGLIKDQQLNWNEHIKYLSSKANKCLWKIRSLRSVLSNQQLKIIIESMLLSQLYYMCVLWGDATKKQLSYINKIIKDAARLLHTNNGCSTSGDNAWFNIEQMHSIKCLLLAYSSKHNLAPPSLHNLINNNAMKTKVTRNSQIMYTDSAMCSSYLQLKYTKLWCSINASTREAENIHKFKRKVKEHITEMSPKSEYDSSYIDEVIDYVRFLYARQGNISDTNDSCNIPTT